MLSRREKEAENHVSRHKIQERNTKEEKKAKGKSLTKEMLIFRLEAISMVTCTMVRS
jgi:hypothetical protein